MAHRFWRRALAVATLAFAMALPSAAPAAAAPEITAITIEGEGLDEALRLTAEERPAHLASVLDQVSWLGKAHKTAAPKEETLGPRYTVVVFQDGEPKQTFDLYPLAEGGPRVYRPKEQPSKRKTSEGWFLGRLSMSESLRSAGAPLPEQIDPLSGGIGGGERLIPEEAINPGSEFGEAFDVLRPALLLNVGLITVITGSIAGLALYVRRRTR